MALRNEGFYPAGFVERLSSSMLGGPAQDDRAKDVVRCIDAMLASGRRSLADDKKKAEAADPIGLAEVRQKVLSLSQKGRPSLVSCDKSMAIDQMWK